MNDSNPYASPRSLRERCPTPQSAFYSHRYVQPLTRVVVLNGGMNILGILFFGITSAPVFVAFVPFTVPAQWIAVLFMGAGVLTASADAW